MNETHEAARAVAALLDLAAVGVEDAIAEIDARLPACSTSRIWSQPMPKWRSASRRSCCWRQFDRLANAVEHDKVVAESVHLDKCQFHRVGRRACAAAQAVTWPL
jgi:hypothetical protein